jgi:hypothetical protein
VPNQREREEVRKLLADLLRARDEGQTFYLRDRCERFITEGTLVGVVRGLADLVLRYLDPEDVESLNDWVREGR